MPQRSWPADDAGGHGRIGDQRLRRRPRADPRSAGQLLGAVAGGLFEQHRPVPRPAIRLPQLREWRRTSSSESGHHLEAVQYPQARAAPARESPTHRRAARARRPRQSPCRGRGRAEVAAVMMPSVPSLPMKRSQQVSRCCPCAGLTGRSTISPSGFVTTSRPEVLRAHCRSAPPACCRRWWWRGRWCSVLGCEAGAGTAGFRRRPLLHRLQHKPPTVMVRLWRRPCVTRPSHGRVQQRVPLSSARRRPPARCCCPCGIDVMPNWHTRVPRRPLSSSSRAHDEAGAAAPALAPVDLGGGCRPPAAAPGCC